MPEQKDDSFKNMSFKDKALTVIGLTLLIGLVLGFVFGTYYFGFVGVFELLGGFVTNHRNIWNDNLCIFHCLALQFNIKRSRKHFI